MFTALYGAINGLDRFQFNVISSSITVSEGKSTPTLTAAKVADTIVKVLAVLTVIGGLIVGFSTGISSFGIASAIGLLALSIQKLCRMALRDKIITRLATSYVLTHSSPRTAPTSTATSEQGSESD